MLNNETALQWRTEQRRVNDLLPLEINPRKITEAKRMKMIESLQRFNLVDIPVIDTDGTIISGHQRLRALQAIGRGDEVIDVRLPNRKLTDKEIKEYNLLANSHFGEFDFDALETDFGDVDFDLVPVDLGKIEFEQSDIFEQAEKKFEKEKAKAAQPEAVEDDFEIPAQVETDIVPGDLFEIGRHRLLCGDSTNSDDVARLMGGEKADMVFTSPPYNLGKNIKLSTRGEKVNAYETYNDDKNEDEYFELLTGFTNSFLPFADLILVNIQSLANNKKTVIDYQYYYKNHIADIAIWYKSNPQPAASKNVMNSAFEYFIFISPEENPTRAIKTGNFHGTFSNVYKGTVNSENIVPEIHSASFPFSMCCDFLNAFSSNSVVDCFMGTGTTMVAAHQLNRKCYGMEIDPKYCQVIITRMLKLDPTLDIKRNGVKWEPVTSNK